MDRAVPHQIRASPLRVRDVPKTFRDMSEAAMARVVGDTAWTRSSPLARDAIALQAKDQLQKLCDVTASASTSSSSCSEREPPDPVSRLQ